MHLRLPVAGALLLACLNAAYAQNAILRIACDDDNVNAEILINGKSMGDCPLDMAVRPGTVQLKAIKKIDAARERVFEQEFRVGEGVAKRVEVLLGAPRLTPEGQRLEAERLRREQAEAQRREEERRRIAAEQARAARARIEVEVEQILTEQRAERGISNVPGCPDCPAAVAAAPDAASQPFPQAPDTVFAEWMRQARTDLQEYLANQGSFGPPASAMAWPCAVDEIALRRLSGDLDLSDLDPADQQKVRAAGKGMQDYLYYHRDVKYWPVKAACKDGKLNGPIEFWMYAARVTSFGDNLMVHPVLKKISATIADGKPVGMVRTLARTGANLTRSRNPQLAEMMKKTRSKFNTEGWMAIYQDNSVASEARTLMVTMNSTEDSNLAQTAIWKMGAAGPNVTIMRPLGGGRGESVTFNGTRKASVMHTKDGKPHGEMIVYGYTIPGGFLLKDMVIPTSTSCFRNGETVTMNPCRVD